MLKYSPLKWFGSKSGQMKRLRLALPESFDYLIEPFCGSAAFSLAMAQENFLKNNMIWINDKNPALMAFWESLRDNENELRSEMLKIRDKHGLGDREIFLWAYDEINKPKNDLLTLAKAQYVVNRLGFGGKAASRSNYCNPFKTGHGFKANEINNFESYVAPLSGVKLTCLDYSEVMPSTPNTLMYLDSPYCGAGGNTPDWDSYGKEFTIIQKEYLEYCESLRDKCQLLISYGDSPEACDAFKNWNVYRIPVIRQGRKEKRQTELLITNYDIPYAELLDDEWELAA